MHFSPITLIHTYLRKVTRKQIFSGPFQGLYYVGESVGSSYYPKILGIYEKELHGILEANKLDTFDKIIVIGAGEGYYAVGLAKKWKRPVIAFEEEKKGRELIARLSLINGAKVFVESRFEAGYDTKSKKDFILIDVEGGEDNLLDEERFAVWSESVILVEVHSTEIKERLYERSNPTHNSFFTPAIKRTMNDYPFSPPFPWVLKRWWWASIQEWRSDSIGWVIFEPRV